MYKPEEFIESGILELYILGAASEEERRSVEAMAAAYPEIQKEIEILAATMEAYANEHAVDPHPTMKPLLFATIDYMNRLGNGEAPAFPPELNEHSRIEDFAEWLNRKDLEATGLIENIHVSIIGSTPQQTTAIVLIKEMAPDEVHTDEFEKFLIVEGTCDIVIGEKTHSLKAGDYLAIPLHENHYVKVTSEIPCKVILQRIAA